MGMTNTTHTTGSSDAETTITYPKPGDLVLATECVFTSGNSSVPFAVPSADLLGVLVKIDDETYAISNDDGTSSVLHYVYSVEEDYLREPRLIISGWKLRESGRVHARWVVTN